MKKIMFITGSRGEWGYIRPILRIIEEREALEYRLIVTNMHLLPAFGDTYKEIEADGFKIHYKIRMALDGYNHYTMSKSLGILMEALPDIIENEQPDWVVLAGDRGEQLVAAIVASYTYTPVAHIQAGEVSGNIDGMARHAIGKFVHLHFASNEDAAIRLKKLGEEEFRIHNVGAPQLDELVSLNYNSGKGFLQNYSCSKCENYILAVFHPVTEEADRAEQQTKIVIEALNHFDMPKIVILPNNDAGSNEVKWAIQEYRRGDYYMFSNLKREDYLGLLSDSSCLVGNSSSGILEAPSFGIPSINIGRRQKGRMRGINVIDVDFDSDLIIAAIKYSMSNDFKEQLKEKCVNPYGDGHSSEKIVEILEKTPKTKELLIKTLTY